MITRYGWTEGYSQAFSDFADLGLVPARVVIQQRGLWQVIGDDFEGPATLTGRFMHEAAAGEHPVAGDWVAIEASEDSAQIHGVLPRATSLSRKAVGHGHATQVLAANVDLALLVMALNGDFNPQRLERYLALAASGGVQAVVVLTKVDIAEDADRKVTKLKKRFPDLDVISISAKTGEGLDGLAAWLGRGQTAVLLGSSGAGKSTLVNALAGEDRMATADVRERDSRGRHTTSHRELIVLPSGALILDTPGMREIGLADGADGVKDSFSDLYQLATHCQFADCRHDSEPKCAVRAAMADGAIDPARLEAWKKLLGEASFESRREDPVVKATHKKRTKAMQKAYNAYQRERD